MVAPTLSRPLRGLRQGVAQFTFALKTLRFERVFRLRSTRFALSVLETFVEAWLRRPCLGRFAAFAKASRNSPAARSVGFASALSLCRTPWRPFLQPIEGGLAKSPRRAQRGASVWIARGRAEGRAAAKARARHPCQGQGAHDPEAMTGAILRQPERLQPQPGLR